MFIFFKAENIHIFVSFLYQHIYRLSFEIWSKDLQSIFIITIAEKEKLKNTQVDNFNSTC